MTTSKLPSHLVTVWNPSYASDAMDEHLRVLLDWAGRARRGAGDAATRALGWVDRSARDDAAVGQR